MAILLSIGMMAALLLYPREAAGAAKNALTIWGLDVVPSLFPYMVLCQSLSSRLTSGHRRSHLFSVVLGILGGSPAGSAALSIAAKKEHLPRKKLLTFTALNGTISPMFFLGPVASWYDSVPFAQRLLIAQYVGAFFAAACVMLLFSSTKTTSNAPSDQNVSDTHQNPITRSVSAVLSVGGCIVFYSVAAVCLKTVIASEKSIFTQIIHLLLEISGGLNALSKTPLHESTKEIIAAAACGFSGLSILSQNLLFLGTHGVTMRHLTVMGILRAAGAALCMAILLSLM